MAKVSVEREGPITIVSIDRFAEARNAVDPETATLLRDAFSDFDADESQSAAILTGRGILRRVRSRWRRREGPALHAGRPNPGRRAICSPSR
jgi:1,4-dihydroxy-2-naphthoyl-CoA synthase